MRTLVLAAFVLILAAVLTPAQDNLLTSNPAEQFFKTSPQVKTLAELATSPAIQAEAIPVQKLTVAGGGGPYAKPLAVLHTSGVYVNRGDEYVATLVMTGAGLPEAYVYYRIVYPDDQGVISAGSRAEYFTPVTGNGQGLFRMGIAGDDVIEVHRERIRSQRPGERLLDVVITDSRGSLLQELFTRFYVYVTVGPPPYFRVRPGATETLTGVPGAPSMGVTVNASLTGRLPVGASLWIMVGGPTTDRYLVSAVADNEKSLRFQFHSFMNNREMDITVYSDSFRESVTCRNCILIGQ